MLPNVAAHFSQYNYKFPLDYSSLVVFFLESTHLIHCTAVVVAAHGVEALCIEKNKLQRALLTLNRIMLWIEDKAAENWRSLCLLSPGGLQLTATDK